MYTLRAKVRAKRQSREQFETVYWCSRVLYK